MLWTLWIGIGSLLAGIGVVLGAFGAHFLKTRVAPEFLVIFETGTRYQLIHALALILLGLIATRTDNAMIKGSGLCFLVGTLIFSGSLYALVATGNKTWGAVTPLGGLLLISGWLILSVTMFRIGT